MADRYDVVERGVRDRLGEGPVWLADRGELAWVDIQGRAIHRLTLRSGAVASLRVPEQVGWILPRQGRHTVVAGFQSGFYELDLDSGAWGLLHSPEPDRPQNRLNDAKVDSAGRIWAGSKDDNDQVASGALYRLDADLACTRVDDGYRVTNGPTFSPDGLTLYHTDSAMRLIYAFDLSAAGEISNKRVWLRFEEEWGYPDGMTTDAEGCLWVAHWAGGALSRFDPTGRRIARIDLPASNITSCAFAGPDLDRLFVTSSNIGCEKEAMAGALFEVDPRVRGIPTESFLG